MIQQTIKFSVARQNLSQLLNQVHRGKNRLLIEKSGIPVAGIISAADLERFALLEKQRERDFEALDVTREAFKDVPGEEIEREIKKAVLSARRQLRKERSKNQPA